MTKDCKRLQKIYSTLSLKSVVPGETITRIELFLRFARLNQPKIKSPSEEACARLTPTLGKRSQLMNMQSYCFVCISTASVVLMNISAVEACCMRSKPANDRSFGLWSGAWTQSVYGWRISHTCVHEGDANISRWNCPVSRSRKRKRAHESTSVFWASWAVWKSRCFRGLKILYETRFLIPFRKKNDLWTTDPNTSFWKPLNFWL